LRLEEREVLLPPLQVALLEQLADARHESRLVLEALLHLEAPRPGEAGDREPFLHSCAGELGDGFAAGRATGVLAQSLERGRVPVLRHARILLSGEARLERGRDDGREVRARPHGIQVARAIAHTPHRAVQQVAAWQKRNELTCCQIVVTLAGLPDCGM